MTSNNDFGPSFSPDGREVVYASFANKATIWKVEIDGGQPVQLTDKESGSPVFSPDGKQIVCFYQDDPKAVLKIAILASGGGAPVTSFTQPNGSGAGGEVRLMPDGRSIAYIVNKGDVGNIWSQPIYGGPPKQITNFTSETIDSFDLSRDGKQIAVSRGTSSSDVVLISGFKK
jgi:Tol biopolymer transport system component